MLFVLEDVALFVLAGCAVDGPVPVLDGTTVGTIAVGAGGGGGVAAAAAHGL